MCCFFHEFRVPFFLSLPLPLSLSLMKFIQIWSSVCFYLFIRLFVCLSWHIRNGTNETRLIFGWVLELTLWFIYSCLKSLQISYSLSLSSLVLFIARCLLFPCALYFRFLFFGKSFTPMGNLPDSLHSKWYFNILNIFIP